MSINVTGRIIELLQGRSGTPLPTDRAEARAKRMAGNLRRNGPEIVASYIARHEPAADRERRERDEYYANFIPTPIGKRPGRTPEVPRSIGIAAEPPEVKSKVDHSAGIASSEDNQHFRHYSELLEARRYAEASAYYSQHSQAILNARHDFQAASKRRVVAENRLTTMQGQTFHSRLR
ncbi:MAG TPA: hypothetical protein VHI52_01100 [Verrucomicrobiae bacterium]|nr:hypothetical protein [Verrucomicrobiae bacterium]